MSREIQDAHRIFDTRETYAPFPLALCRCIGRTVAVCCKRTWSHFLHMQFVKQYQKAHFKKKCYPECLCNLEWGAFGRACITSSWSFQKPYCGFFLYNAGKNKSHPQFTICCLRSLDWIARWRKMIYKEHASAQLLFNLFHDLSTLSSFFFWLQQKARAVLQAKASPKLP